MKLMAFSIFDRKAMSYDQPFFVVNEVTAVRMFDRTARDASTMIAAYPEDYVLVHVGEFDTLEARFLAPPEGVRQLVTASALIAQSLQAKEE